MERDAFDQPSAVRVPARYCNPAPVRDRSVPRKEYGLRGEFAEHCPSRNDEGAAALERMRTAAIATARLAIDAGGVPLGKRHGFDRTVVLFWTADVK